MTAHDEQLKKAASRALAIRQSRNDLLAFTRYMMYDPRDEHDARLSRYEVAQHHRYIAQALHKLESGEWRRLIISVPPRHGKSCLASHHFPAWYMGRDPYRSMILATYNENFAKDFGRQVRHLMKSDRYNAVFPGARLRTSNASADRLQTEAGGLAVFVGSGGSLTGRGADCLTIDDPTKDREQADSKLERDKQWAWFMDVAMTRLMTAESTVCIIQTRWHEDDLVGRLTDPGNPCYIAEEAAQWKVLNLPALAGDNDPMGRKPGEPLWPTRFDERYLTDVRRQNPKGFASLYQGQPFIEDGDYFKSDWLETYRPGELPADLMYYCGSDHAVSTDQQNDFTVLCPAGVCTKGYLWVLPDVWWRKAQSDVSVEAMLELMRKYQFQAWWAESGQISKAIGPFLKRRMHETNTFCPLIEVASAAKKEVRAQAIKGRMSMGRVKFPAYAPWWTKAREEMLKFPSGRHDDFVDAISIIGANMHRHIAASEPVQREEEPKVGTIDWIKSRSNYEKRRARSILNQGW